MKILRSFLLVLVLATACLPTPMPPAAPTPTPPNEIDLLRAALTDSHQGDLALVENATRYTITLTYTAEPPSLVGSQTVTYWNRQTTPLREIYFRLFANFPDSGGKISVTNVTVDGTPASTTLEAQDTALRVGLAQPLAPGAARTVRMDFNVAVPRVNSNRYADFGVSDTIITLPSVYPVIPAYDAQGWHLEVPPPYGDLIYADASLYAVTLTAPATLTVIASGSTVDVRANSDGTRTWKLIGAPMRDFDLNLTAHLQKATATLGETTINSWYESEDAENGKQALQFATDALRVFQKRLGAYPYRELDVVQTPTSAGGIEYPGIIVIGRNLYKDKKERDFFEFATAHEVGHQWFYGVVGNDQVNVPWLDEALVQYVTLIYYEDVRGARAAQSLLKGYFQDGYARTQQSGRDATVNQPVAAFSEASYSAIVYGKGPLFFDALRKKMGDDHFFQFLRTYYERYRYKNAAPEDLLRAAEEVCACSVRAEYQQWITSAGK